MKLATTIVLIGSLGIIGLRCDKSTDPPPPGDPPVRFEAIDASCTEVWLEVKFSAGAQPRTIEIRRDTLPVLTATLTGTDTLVVDEGLLPNRQYTYTITRPGVPYSQPITTAITTMDTTSHDWVFDPPVLLGDGSSSVLYDVAIVRADPDSPLVYAVGELYLSGEPTRYNLAVWNGNDWNIQRVPYYYQGQPFYHPIQTIFAFAPDDIWFAGNGVIRWNGHQYVPVEIPSSIWGPNRINKIWGHEGEIWIVGDGGSIAHRSATGTWRRLESGTTTSVLDAWGMRSSLTGKIEVYCAVSSFFEPGDIGILRITDQTRIDPIPWDPGRLLSGVWTHQNFHIFTAGDGVFQSRSGGWRELDIGANIYTNRIRGSSLNNIIVVGDFGLMSHWNGTGWRLMSMDFNIGYSSVAVMENLVVAVGQKSGRGVATTMRRD